MELTDDEAARIRRAYLTAGPLNYERLAKDKAKRARSPLLSFINAWHKLDIEEKAAVSLELARLASPDEGDTGGEELSLSVSPHDLDVGLAAARAAADGKDTQGNKVRRPGLREAVTVAFQIWVERGNPPELGRFWRPAQKEKMLTQKKRKELPPKDTDLSEHYRTYPSLDFVADAIQTALKFDQPDQMALKFGIPELKGLRLDFPNRQAFLIAVDSQLRASRELGEI